MKTLKALIIEDQEGVAYAITSCILDVVLFLNLKVDFIYAREYEIAREQVMSMDYDIISLDGTLGNRPSLNLISTILNLHPKATIFFLSSSQELVIKAKNLGITLSFLKGNEQIINQKDLLQIKNTLIDKGKVNYEVLYQELPDALLIFSEPKVNQELFDDSESKYLQVTKILQDNEVNFTIVDRDANTKIFVDGSSSQMVKKLAEISELKFWIEWSNKFIY